MIYLASPYSHPDPSVRAYRFEAVCRTAATLIKAGLVVISPIAHSHPIFERDPETGSDFEAWRELNETLLAACDEMYVLALDGWEQSVGVREEMRYARDTLGIPVRLIGRNGAFLATLS